MGPTARFLYSASIVMASSLLWPAAASPQSFSGSVNGTIRDPQGGRVPGAELVLENDATGVELERSCADDGTYTFRNLVPGTYTLQVSHRGFSLHRQRAIEVRLGSDVRVDVG